MKLYLVRHGQTNFNASSLHQHGNVELSEKGIGQAETLAKRFSNIKIDVIYTSPFQRAKHTAEIINKNFNKEIIESEFLQEKKNPSEIVGKSRKSSEVLRIKELIEEKADDPFWHYSDEENFTEFKKRVFQFLPFVEKENHKNVLAVSHSGTIRAMALLIALGESLSFTEYNKFRVFQLDNTGITLCEKDERGNWTVRAFNDHSHLG